MHIVLLASMAAVAGSLFAGPAMAQSVGEKTGINATLGITPKTQDFVTEAATSDMFEVQSATLALSKLTGADKAFADRLVADHTKTTQELTERAKSANVQLPTQLDAAHRDKLQKLQDLSGDRFRRQFFSDQVSGHKSAVSLFERYGKGGENAQLKQWAATTLPALQEHLKMAQDLNSKK